MSVTVSVSVSVSQTVLQEGTARISLRVPVRYVDNDPPRRLPCSCLGRVGLDASEAKVSQVRGRKTAGVAQGRRSELRLRATRPRRRRAVVLRGILLVEVNSSKPRVRLLSRESSRGTRKPRAKNRTRTPRPGKRLSGLAFRKSR